MEFSSGYNCKETGLEKQTNNDVLGNKPNNTILDWLNEPLVALETLFHTIKITLCGPLRPLTCALVIKYAKNEPIL
jgi:hypothetical protein